MPREAPSDPDPVDGAAAASQVPSVALTAVKVVLGGAVLIGLTGGMYTTGMFTGPRYLRSGFNGNVTPAALAYEAGPGPNRAPANPWLLGDGPDHQPDTLEAGEVMADSEDSAGSGTDPVTSTTGGPGATTTTSTATSFVATTTKSTIRTSSSTTSTVKPKPTATTLSEEASALRALETQLAKDIDAVIAAAAARMAPLETEKRNVIAALNTKLTELEKARDAAKAPLLAELEATTDPARRSAIESELLAIEYHWRDDRDAAYAEADPVIRSLREQLSAIERERDAEIARLEAAFDAAVAGL